MAARVASVVSAVRRLAACVGSPSVGDQEGHWDSTGSQEGPSFQISKDASCWVLIPLVSR